MKKIFFWFLIVSTSLVFGFITVAPALERLLTPSLNKNPPSYIKQVAAYKEGSDGIEGYLVLADNDGNITTASGVLTLEIYGMYTETWMYGNIDHEILYYKTQMPIDHRSFIKATVGTGSFERETVLFVIKRIPYSEFKDTPATDFGKIRTTFTTEDGRELKGEGDLIFNDSGSFF